MQRTSDNAPINVNPKGEGRGDLTRSEKGNRKRIETVQLVPGCLFSEY